MIGVQVSYQQSLMFESGANFNANPCLQAAHQFESELYQQAQKNPFLDAIFGQGKLIQEELEDLDNMTIFAKVYKSNFMNLVEHGRNAKDQFDMPLGLVYLHFQLLEKNLSDFVEQYEFNIFDVSHIANRCVKKELNGISALYKVLFEDQIQERIELHGDENFGVKRAEHEHYSVPQLHRENSGKSKAKGSKKKKTCVGVFSCFGGSHKVHKKKLLL